MADPYIDQFETLLYGKFAREQMEKVCLGRIKELDSAVKFAVAQQSQADADMKAVLDKQPQPASSEDASTTLEEARDTVVRFGSYLNSLKGYPVSPKVFFRNENPSDVARKRLVKLTAAIEHIVNEIPKHDAIKDPAWLKDFKSVQKKLAALQSAQQSSKLEKADLGPEVAAQREKWLAVYGANKLLIRGVLAHAGKPELLSLVFDDLAEVHRAPGVSDAGPTAPTEAAPTEPT
jgi:2-succinyl-5-enolpyruvyl-6-hydroxy-3-cyclohexene-1-carboxylate synthase